MLFSSVSFLYYFLPVVLALYFTTPFKYKNTILLLASLFFYFYGEPIYCLLMVISILSAYWHGILIYKARNSRFRRVPLISSITISLAALAFFKYYAFFISNLNSLVGTSIDPLHLALPIGISFYTFQTLSYTIDVYRGSGRVQTNLINFATYISMFPQLVAGPIVRYTTIEADLTNRTHTLADTANGIKRFVIGLAKKVIIANTLGELSVSLNGMDEQTVLAYWIAAIAFTLQIYFDFSGYSDMAIGLGRVFGFRFLENFNYPYIARTVSEFWHRWHISLGSWFRDYVYIPLGGNRVNLSKWIRNVIIVWFLTGFWHGAEWNFIIWGIYFAFFLVLEKYVLRRLLARAPSIFSHVYLLTVVVFGFVIFNANGLTPALEALKGMTGATRLSFSSHETMYYLKSYGFVIIFAAMAATPLMSNLLGKLTNCKTGRSIGNILQPALIVIILLLVTGYLVDGSFNPFIYFRF